MFYLKGCTKCQGDLTLEKDAYGDFLKCMQCGTLIEVQVEVYSPGSLMKNTRARTPRKTRVEAVVAA